MIAQVTLMGETPADLAYALESALDAVESRLHSGDAFDPGLRYQGEDRDGRFTLVTQVLPKKKG